MARILFGQKYLKLQKKEQPTLGIVEQEYQVFDVEILEGKFEGEIATVDYGFDKLHAPE